MTFSHLQATEEKAKVEAEAAACLTRLSLAERLVGGLSSENERWGNEIEKLRHSATTLVGDCMLASGFVSYVGAFDQANRDILWKNVWTPGEAGYEQREEKQLCSEHPFRFRYISHHVL